MPKQWESRAAVGAGLLLVVVPLMVLTGTALGYHPPTWVLQVALGLELLAAIFALALIVLPHRMWRLGRHYSDALHGLSIPTFRVVWGINTDGTVSTSVRVKIQSTAEIPIKYHLETIDLAIDDVRATAPVLRTRGGVIPRRGESEYQMPRIDGLVAGEQLRTGVLSWTALYGPASGDYEVRWHKEMELTWMQSSPDANFLDRQPETHEVIKPIRTPPL